MRAGSEIVRSPARLVCLPRRARATSLPSRKMLRQVLVCLISVLGNAPPAFGQRPVAPPKSPSERKHVRAYRLDTVPVIDGRVDELLWTQIEPATSFVQQQPDEGSAATEKTEVRFGYDDRNLYIGIICFDSQPGHIVVTQNRRDGNLVDTDSVQILLDTFHDRQNAFVFGTSPTGIEYDAQVSKAGLVDSGGNIPRAGQGGAQQAGAAAVNLNWDAVWRVRSQITERGWESEMVIPFKTLRYNPGSGRVWGLQIMRNLRRRNEQSFWMPVSRAFDLTQVDVAGDLENVDLRLHRDLQVVPYVLGGFNQDYSRSVRPTRMSRNAGLDVKYSVTPSLTLDATINTDFAQVEVDEEQINLTRFNLFFPEKRPFFLENSGIFDFGAPRETEIFFSRRIGIDDSGAEIPIDAGVRLSGHAGRYDLGFLNVKTREVDGIAPANNFFVARAKRELANRSSIGVIAVSRESLTHFDGKRPFNRTYGADANIGLGRYGNWQNYIAKTDSPGLSGSTLAALSSFRYDNSHHQVSLSYREVGRNFNPEVGYLERANYRRPSFGYRRTLYPDSKRIRSIFPHFQWNRWYTLGTNALESAFEHYDFSMGGQGGEMLSIAYNRSFERLDVPFEIFPGIRVVPGRYWFGELDTNYATNQSARVFAGLRTSTGSFYSGTIRAFVFSAGVRKGTNLTWTGSYARNFINLREGDFTTDLVGFRFNWSFTPKSYLQSFTQYNSRTAQIGTNIRFALLSTSSNGLFVVFNTRAATVDYTDPHGIARVTQSRALLVKYNRLFDF
ncbi:MAG: hypothetical protein C5B51_14240 [Terriglobia bacterium]|nr:MAG: hypothetical protein C5B51_14240 [Terriglobia bacterium]